MPNMTGWPGIPDNGNANGGSFAAYLARTPFPLFCALFNRGGKRRAFRLPGAGGDHVHCAVEPSPDHIRRRLSLQFQLSGVARGLLQGRSLQLPMGWGVGEQLTKSWPTFEQLCVQNLALAISCCFSPTMSEYKIQLAGSWPRLGHGLANF